MTAKKFALLQKAKATLCDSESRRNYDKWRLSGMCMSYQDWCNRKDAVHTVSSWLFSFFFHATVKFSLRYKNSRHLAVCLDKSISDWSFHITILDMFGQFYRRWIWISFLFFFFFFFPNDKPLHVAFDGRTEISRPGWLN